ncbi:MAG TPA: iron-sulfur cluster assembly protein [Solirubrobacterales bacterium]
MSSSLDNQVAAALNTVLDPCSVFNGTRLSIVELGMVDEVVVDDGGDVLVRLFLDDPTCIFFFEISRMVKEAIGQIEGVGAIDLEIKADEIWTEDRMDPAARERLASIRAKRSELSEERGVAAGWPLPMVDAGITGTPLPMAKETVR